MFKAKNTNNKSLIAIMVLTIVIGGYGLVSAENKTFEVTPALYSANDTDPIIDLPKPGLMNEILKLIRTGSTQVA